MSRIIDVDELKYCLQNHYGVVGQDCGVSEDFVEGAISGLDAAMFEINCAHAVDAIPVGWIIDRANDPERAPLYRRYAQMLYEEWQKEQEGQDG